MIRVKSLTLRLLMSYINIYIYDISSLRLKGLGRYIHLSRKVDIMQWLNHSLYQKSETVSLASLSDATTNRSIKQENTTYQCKHITLAAKLLNSVRSDLCSSVFCAT